MDPIQVLAASNLADNKTSTAKDIEAFYDTHSFEQLHTARRAVVGLVRFIRNAPIRLGRRVTTAPKVASSASQA